jgi:hypothetical protein
MEDFNFIRHNSQYNNTTLLQRKLLQVIKLQRFSVLKRYARGTEGRVADLDRKGFSPTASVSVGLCNFLANVLKANFTH